MLGYATVSVCRPNKPPRTSRPSPLRGRKLRAPAKVARQSIRSLVAVIQWSTCMLGIGVHAVLKVVQERSRDSPAIRGRVPLPRIFFNIYFWYENDEFWCILGGILCDLELQKSKQETGVDPVNQRVPGLRPWRPGPTLSPAYMRDKSIPLAAEVPVHVFSLNKRFGNARYVWTNLQFAVK